MSVGNRYALFEKHSLYEYLNSVLNKRRDFQWASLFGLIASLGGALYTKWPTIVSQHSSPTDVIVVAVLVALLGLALVLFIVSVVKWKKYGKYTAEYIKNELEKAQVRHDITAVFLIKKNMSGIPYVLVMREPNWGYMLPYKRLADNLDSYESQRAAKDSFDNRFNGVSANLLYQGSMGLDSSIKINPDKSDIMKVTYGFYVVVGARKAAFDRFVLDVRNFSYEWKSISDLYNDPVTMKFNSDVINCLAENNFLASVPDFFEGAYSGIAALPSELKVIWNITDHCTFDCSFCGTHRPGSSIKLPFKDKLKIADELLKIPGVKIDIAGGDPLMDDDAKDAIIHIAKYMTSGNLTITSTGKALSSLNAEELNRLLSVCKSFDISYDFPSRWDTVTHRQPSYNQLNHKQLIDLSVRGIEVTVLVTLSAENTSDPHAIEMMLNELAGDLQTSQITLLRLMPVGKQSFDSYPAEYHPMQAINRFKEKFGSTVKLQCAFRAILDENGKCNMLSEKIGVDSDGNVFACAWAGYIANISLEENPFYLGNILATGGIENIFKSRRYSELKKALEDGQAGCRIFSFLNNPNAWSSTIDPGVLGKTEGG